MGHKDSEFRVGREGSHFHKVWVALHNDQDIIGTIMTDSTGSQVDVSEHALDSGSVIERSHLGHFGFFLRIKSTQLFRRRCVQLCAFYLVILTKNQYAEL